MARRETTVTITREGRDQGKTYTLRELPAAQAEEWFYRAMMLLARSGADVPPDIFQQGAIGFATMGLGTVLTGLGKAPWHEVKPLLDEMLPCVVALASPAGVPITGAQIWMQTEEPATIVQLREEVLSLHLNFSIAARLSDYAKMAAALITTIDPGPIMPMSDDPSASLSPVGLQH